MPSTDEHTSHQTDLQETAISGISHGKRRRALVACASCRRRKVRCDSARPHCGNCVRAGIECVYMAEKRRKRTRLPALESNDEDNRSNSSHLQQRLDRLESMLSILLEKQGVTNLAKPADQVLETNDDRKDSSGSESGSDISELEDTSDSSDDETNVCDSKSRSRTSPHGSNGSHMDSGYREGADIFQLHERRAPVVIMSGGQEPLVTYTYGFTPPLLSPKSMRWLCESIGNHTLGVQAEAILSRVWKQKTCSMLDAGKKLHTKEVLDPKFVEYSIQMHKLSTSQVMHTLISEKDLLFIRKICCPSGDYSQIDYSSPYSLVYPSLVMTYTQYGLKMPANPSQFPEERITEQNQIAFQTCLRQLSYFSWGPATFLLLRLLLLTTFTISRKVLLPQLRGLISLTIYMALNLGLYSPEGGRYLPPEVRQTRSIVWALIHDLDVKTASYLSLMPLMVNHGHIPAKLRVKLVPGSDLEHLSTSLSLDKIYTLTFHRLFSRKAQKTSVKTMLVNLCKIDDKLRRWKDNLPEAFLRTCRLVDEKEACDHKEMNLRSESGDLGALAAAAAAQCAKEDIIEPGPSVQGLTNEMCGTWIQVSTMISYYNILILIHSIPAFSPSCLDVFAPEEVPHRLKDSLNIISESAKKILKFTFNMKRVQSDECLALTATNAFSALFLKQIRDPRHPTNAEDLIQIYRYIAKFRTVTETMNTTDAQSIINIWLIFANALTQLNREYFLQQGPLQRGPSQQESSQQVPSQKVPSQQVPAQRVPSQQVPSQSMPPKPVPSHYHDQTVNQPVHPSYPEAMGEPRPVEASQVKSECLIHTITPPDSVCAGPELHQGMEVHGVEHHAPGMDRAPQKHQGTEGPYHIASSVPLPGTAEYHNPHLRPMQSTHPGQGIASSGAYATGPGYRADFTNAQSYAGNAANMIPNHPQQQHPYSPAPDIVNVPVVNRPGPDSVSNMTPNDSIHGSNFMNNAHASFPPVGPTMDHVDPSDEYSGRRSSHDVGSLWEAFSGLASVDMNIDEDELLSGFNSFEAQALENPPNSCTIC